MVSTLAYATASWAMFIMAVGAGLVLALSLRPLGMQLPRLSGAALWLAWWEVKVAVGWPTWRLTSLVAGLALAIRLGAALREGPV